MIYCCALRLWSQICVTCQSCWFPDSVGNQSQDTSGNTFFAAGLSHYCTTLDCFSDVNNYYRVALCCADVVPEQDASGPRQGCIRTTGLRNISPTQNLSVVVVKLCFFRVCSVRRNLYGFCLYRNPDLDDRIFDCLLASMAEVQAKDIRASILFVDDLNGHHQEWLGSTTMHRHGVAAFDFATVSSCDQLVVGPTHVRGGTLDLLMTDVPDLVLAAVVAPISNSDHSSLSAVISMAHAVLNLCVSRKVSPKHQLNWSTVCGAIRDLPWRNICHADNPIEVLNEHLSLVVGRNVPTMVTRVCNNNYLPCFDDQCRDVSGEFW